MFQMEGVILSSWDYIMGPQIERLWLVSHNPTVQSTEVPLNVLRDFNTAKVNNQSDFKNELNIQNDFKTYSFMCGQLLLGEMDASETYEENSSRTYISDFKILTCIVFRMKSWIYVGTVKAVKNVSLCLGLIYKRKALNFVLHNQFTIDSYLRKLADILQNSKSSQETALNEVSDVVIDLAPVLDSLYHASIDHIQIHMLSILDYPASGILCEAIVSHLQTSGHTIVLGGSEFKIKQITNVLSLFSSKEELCCSLPINHWPLKSKVSSFCIQGIIKNSEKDCEYLLEKAYTEMSSLTIIDSDLSKVWQTYPFHDSFEKNRVFSSVTEVGCFVPQLIKDLTFANKNDADCHTIIENFSKLLMIKAVAVVKAVSHFRNIKRILSKQELMKLFSIKMLADFQIILGCAEKVKPGIRCSIL